MDIEYFGFDWNKPAKEKGFSLSSPPPDDAPVGEILYASDFSTGGTEDWLNQNCTISVNNAEEYLHVQWDTLGATYYPMLNTMPASSVTSMSFEIARTQGTDIDIRASIWLLDDGFNILEVIPEPEDNLKPVPLDTYKSYTKDLSLYEMPVGVAYFMLAVVSDAVGANPRSFRLKNVIIRGTP